MIQLRLSLKNRVISLIAGIIIFFGVIAVAVVYRSSAGHITQLQNQQVSELSRQVSITLTKTFEASANLSKTVALDDRVIESLLHPQSDHQKLNLQLSAYDPSHSFSAIYILNRDGVALASTDLSFIGQDYSFRQYFQKSLAGENYSNAYLGVTSGQLGYYFSTPIIKDGQIIGVAVVKTNPNQFDQLIKSAKIDPFSDLLLVDSAGVIVATTRPNRLYKSLGPLSSEVSKKIASENKYPSVTIMPLSYTPVQTVVESLPNTVTTIALNDVEDDDQEVMIVSPIKNTSFYLVGEVSLRTVNQVAKNLSLIISSLVLLCVLGAVVVIIVAVNRLSQPLSHLISLSEAVARGEFPTTNPIKSKNELSSLADSIIQMSQVVKNRYSELEAMVADRTQKLTIQNELSKKNQSALLNVLEDIETEKATDEALLASIGDGVIATDPEGIVLVVNQSAVDQLGWKKEDVVGHHIYHHLTIQNSLGQPVPKSERPFYKSIHSGKKITTDLTSPIFCVRKDGSKFPVIITATPVFVSQKLIGSIVVFRDISHEYEVDRMKTDFISLASHQLRTPLSAMKWYLEMLLHGDAGKLKKEQLEFIDNTNQSNERIIALVNSLLNISRIESGRLIIDPKPTKLQDLLSDVIKELSLPLKDKNIQPIISINPKLPDINIDPQLTREVFKNILTNAIKYTPKDGDISITISKNDVEVIIQISDSGMGIPQKEQDKIFQKFYRASNVAKIVTEGTGLGLYLIKAIVESSNGRIWFKSQENHGTTFWFSLPLAGVKPKAGEVTLNS